MDKNRTGVDAVSGQAAAAPWMHGDSADFGVAKGFQQRSISSQAAQL